MIVNASQKEYPLSSLSSDTLYMVQMAAYTEKGGRSGPPFTFMTKKFGNTNVPVFKRYKFKQTVLDNYFD